MGNGAGGGTRTTLAGTFVAERTHSNPPKYTLVSVETALASGVSGGNGLGDDASPGVSTSAPKTKRRMASEKGAIKCTEIKALDNIEPLLSSEEAVPHPPKPPQVQGPPLPGQPAPPMPAEAVPPAVPQIAKMKGKGITAAGPAGFTLQRSAVWTAAAADEDAWSVDGSVDTQTAEAAERQEVFNRLAGNERRPWVASKTDSQLLTYLARRSRDPQIATPDSSRELSSPSTSTRLKLRHRSHRELFDTCLDRGSLGGAKSTSASAAGGHSKPGVSSASTSSGGSSSMPPTRAASNHSSTPRPVTTPRPASTTNEREPGGVFGGNWWKAHDAGGKRMSKLQHPTSTAIQNSIRRGKAGGSRRLHDFLQTVAIVPVPEDAVGSFFANEEVEGSRRAAARQKSLGSPQSAAKGPSGQSSRSVAGTAVRPLSSVPVALT